MPQPSLDVNAVLQGEKNVHHTFLVIVCVQQPSACQRARSEPVRNGSSKHIGDRVQLMLGQRSGYPSHLERNIVKPAWSEASPEMAEPGNHDSDSREADIGAGRV